MAYASDRPSKGWARFVSQGEEDLEYILNKANSYRSSQDDSRYSSFDIPPTSDDGSLSSQPSSQYPSFDIPQVSGHDYVPLESNRHQPHGMADTNPATRRDSQAKSLPLLPGQLRLDTDFGMEQHCQFFSPIIESPGSVDLDGTLNLIPAQNRRPPFIAPHGGPQNFRPTVEGHPYASQSAVQYPDSHNNASPLYQNHHKVPPLTNNHSLRMSSNPVVSHNNMDSIGRHMNQRSATQLSAPPSGQPLSGGLGFGGPSPPFSSHAPLYINTPWSSPSTSQANPSIPSMERVRDPPTLKDEFGYAFPWEAFKRLLRPGKPLSTDDLDGFLLPIGQESIVDVHGRRRCRAMARLPENGLARWETLGGPCDEVLGNVDSYRRHIIHCHLGCPRQRGKTQPQQIQERLDEHQRALKSVV